MSRITYIRLATYAVLILCIAFAHRRHFIPLRLPAVGTDVDWWWGFDEMRHGGESPTLLPGFADTRLSGVRIVRIAEECVAKEKIDPAKLSWLKIHLATVEDKLVWVVTWDIVKDPTPAPADFRVVIEDETGRATFERTNDRWKRPNQSPEPTALLVTPRADARVAPSNAVAHL